LCGGVGYCPWGALSDRELMGTARQKGVATLRCRCPAGVVGGSAGSLWVWVVVPEGDPHSVLTGAVAAQVVAADLRATSVRWFPTVVGWRR